MLVGYVSLTQEAIDPACNASSSLAAVQGSQLMENNPSPPSPPSPTASTQAKEDPGYCTICAPLGEECPGRLCLLIWMRKMITPGKRTGTT